MMSELQPESPESNARKHGGIFYDDWVACLGAHYLYTVAQNDAANALSLRRVLLEAGMTNAYVDSLTAAPVTDEPAVADPPDSAATVDAVDAVDAVEPGQVAVVAEVVEPVVLVDSVQIVETAEIVAATPPSPLPESLAAAVDDQPVEPVAVVDMTEALPVSAAVPDDKPVVVTPSPDVELVPDYPSAAKPAKRGKRPPPQPTLF